MFKHTNRKGFWLGFVDFFTAGLFFLMYMPLGGLQNELEQVLGHKVRPYWQAYLLGIPTFFYLHACLDGPDSRRTEIQSDIIRNRRPLHILVAHVRLERLRTAPHGPGSGHLEIL